MSIKNFENKSFFTLATYTSISNISLSGDMNIIIDNIIDLFKKNCNNYDDIRDCTIVSNV